MTASSQLVHRAALETSDPGQALAIIDQIYEVDVRFSAPPATRWDLMLSSVTTPNFAVASFRLPGVLEMTSHAERDVVISTLIRGSTAIERGPEVSCYAIGDAFIAVAPEGEWRATWEHVQSHAVTLPKSLLTDLTNNPDSDASEDWAFSAYQATASGSRSWRQATRFVDDLLASPGRLTPLTISAAGQLLAATALSVFPNNAVAPTTIEDRRDAHPATVHRAISFIEATPDLDITVRDIARAAFVTPRTLQLAFRRHLDTTPMAYLRRVRLDHVRSELRDADPAAGATVTQIAARWGFADGSRLSAQYRAVYGESPSRTLRRS